MLLYDCYRLKSIRILVHWKLQFSTPKNLLDTFLVIFLFDFDESLNHDLVVGWRLVQLLDLWGSVQVLQSFLQNEQQDYLVVCGDNVAICSININHAHKLLVDSLTLRFLSGVQGRACVHHLLHVNGNHSIDNRTKHLHSLLHLGLSSTRIEIRPISFVYKPA